MPQTNYLREIENQALSFLRNYALTAFLCFVVSFVLITVFIYESYKSPILFIWLGIVCIAQLCSLFYRQKMPISRISHEQKLRRGMVINIFDGLIVSSLVLFFPVIDDINRMLIVILLLMACTGAITTTVGYLKFYLAFTLPIFISILSASIITPFAFNGSNTLYIIFATSLMVSMLLLQLSAGIFNNFKDAISARLEISNVNLQLKSAVKTAKLANQSKTRFLASASHDLRQPINVLSLFIANLSLKDTKGEYADIISHMNTAINSVDAQLESLLDISKLDAGIVDVKLKETNLAKVTEELVSGYPDTEKVKVKFNSEFEDLIVETDIALFERILTNLISNSIKYTSEGYIEVSLECIDDNALIRVRDTGIGIRANEFENIFDEFYQVNNPERNSVNGLGLGLSIVKRLAKLLNIKISLYSQYGLGTEVTMKMDFKRASIPNIFEIETASIASITESKRVLVLDNEIGIVIAVKAVLETMNHSVETFTCSNKALRCFEDKRFDLALIDYRLSDGVLGNDVIERMHSINSRTKFFLVTGDNNIQGGDNFEIIHKPVTSTKLDIIFCD